MAKKGVGFAKDPKRSIYNKVYNKTTFSLYKLLNKGVKLDYNLNGHALEKWNKENAAWHDLAIAAGYGMSL